MDDAGLRRIPESCRGEVVIENYLAGAHAKLIVRRHLHAPVGGGLLAIGKPQVHLHQLLRFSKGGAGNFGTHGMRGSECRRRAGGRFRGWVLRRSRVKRGGQDAYGTVGEKLSASARHGSYSFQEIV